MPDFGSLKERLLQKISQKLPSDFLSAIVSHYRVHGEATLFIRQRTYSERIAARKLAPHPAFAPLSDKAEVRDFVRSRVGERYLIPLYAVTDDVDTFDFSTLPRSFAMKATHGSGWVKLVHDSSAVCVEELRATARAWISQNYSRRYRERQYQSLRPRIIFEKLLLENGQPARDFKVHCFRKRGKLTQIIQIHLDRFKDHKVNFFDCDWKPLSLSHGYGSAPGDDIARPARLAEINEIAAALSADFNYVRVDLYIVGDDVYFGELTFTPGAGLLRFYPSDMDRLWATMFDREIAPVRTATTFAGAVSQAAKAALVLPLAGLSVVAPSEQTARLLPGSVEEQPNSKERRGYSAQAHASAAT